MTNAGSVAPAWPPAPPPAVPAAPPAVPPPRPPAAPGDPRARGAASAALTCRAGRSTVAAVAVACAASDRGATAPGDAGRASQAAGCPLRPRSPPARFPPARFPLARFPPARFPLARFPPARFPRRRSSLRLLPSRWGHCCNRAGRETENEGSDHRLQPEPKGPKRRSNDVCHVWAYCDSRTRARGSQSHLSRVTGTVAATAVTERVWPSRGCAPFEAPARQDAGSRAARSLLDATSLDGSQGAHPRRQTGRTT